MSKSAKGFFVFFLVLLLMVPCAVFAAAVGEFTSVTGKVTLTRAGKVYSPVVKTQLALKDLIVTGSNSEATLVFSDESMIKLSQNSKLEIREFLFKDKTRKGLFSLEMGKLVADVKKFIGGGSAFEVHSPTAIAGIRGTGFEVVIVGVGSQMATTVTCTTGALSVSALSATGAVISTTTIVAGQAAVITATGITVSAAGAVGAGAGTAVATGTGTGTITTGAAGAGAAAGTATVAGVGVGTIAAGAVVAAVAVAAVVAANSSSTTTTHH